MTCAFSLLDRDVSLKVFGSSLEFRPVCLFLVVGFFCCCCLLSWTLGSHTNTVKTWNGNEI